MVDWAAFWVRVQERMDDLGFDLKDVERISGVNYHRMYSSRLRGSKVDSEVAQAVAKAVRSPLRYLEQGEGDKEVAMSPSAAELAERLEDMPEHLANLLLRVAETWEPKQPPAPEEGSGGPDPDTRK